jgi:hypothetical protein
MERARCPFCNPEADLIFSQSSAAIALPDAFPVAAGHTLVVPRQDVASIFYLSESGQAQLWQLVAQVRSSRAEQGRRPDHPARPYSHHNAIRGRRARSSRGNPLDHPGEGGLLEGYAMSAPTTGQQVMFLTNLQRFLAEGQFVATYKYALLLTLADIAIESGNDL